MSRQQVEARCTFCIGTNERDNPYDKHLQPKEHAAWQDAFQTVCQEYGAQRDGRVGDIALKEDLVGLPEQREFALVWRPFRFPFRLHINDVIRLDGRLGRVIRVTDCAAVVLMNRRVRQFITRFDKPVHFQPPPILVRIGSNSETEILNRKPKTKRKTERRTA